MPNWNVDQVVWWLEDKGFRNAAKQARKQKVDGHQLMSFLDKGQKNIPELSKEKSKNLIEMLRNIDNEHIYPSDDSFDEYPEGEYNQDTDGAANEYLDPDRDSFANENDLEITSKPHSFQGAPTLPPRNGKSHQMNQSGRGWKSPSGPIRNEGTPPRLPDFSRSFSDSDYEEPDPEEEYELEEDRSFPAPPARLPLKKQINSNPSKESNSLIHSNLWKPEQPGFKPNPQTFNSSFASPTFTDGLEYSIDFTGQQPQMPPTPPPLRPEANPLESIAAGSRYPEDWQDESRQIPTPKFHTTAQIGPKISEDDLKSNINRLKKVPKTQPKTQNPEVFDFPRNKHGSPPKPADISREIEQKPAMPWKSPKSEPLPVVTEKPVLIPKTPLRPPNIKTEKKDSPETSKWYQNIDRKEAESKLNAIKKNGAFVVRPSSRDSNKPYILVVYLDGDVKNIPIRKVSNRYALGREAKPNEMLFHSVVDILTHYSKEKLVLAANGSMQVTLVNINP